MCINASARTLNLRAAMIAVHLKPAVLRLPKPVQLPVLVLLVPAPVLLVPALVLLERALVLPLAMLRLLVLPVLALVLLLATLRRLVLPALEHVLRLATLRPLADRPAMAVLLTVPIAELRLLKTAVLLPSAANNLAAMMIRAKSPN